MKRRDEELPDLQMTSMIDIIFQLLIFFLVTLSFNPSEVSAPMIEGIKQIATPTEGDNTVSMVIQIVESREGYEYYVLQGNRESAQFFRELSPADTGPMLRQLGRMYQVYYTIEDLYVLLQEVGTHEPEVILRAPEHIPYGVIIRLHSYMNDVGIAKIGWLKGTFRDLQVEIVETRRR